MKTILTGELAEKRDKIMKSHSIRLFALSAIALPFPVIMTLAAQSLRIRVSYPLLLPAISFFILAIGFRHIVQHDARLCRDLAFLCPFCQKPLYEPRALLINTLCPKCGKDIVNS